MFYINRDDVPLLMKKINEGKNEVKAILDELSKERDKEKADSLRALYKEKLERNKLNWHAYKQTLGKQSQLLFDAIEKEQGVRMIPSFKTYLEKKFDEKKEPKKKIDFFREYVLEWEKEKQKEKNQSPFALQGIFTYLVRKDARFLSFLSSQVEVNNYTMFDYEGNYEDPTPVYRKKMVITITDFIMENHPVLQYAKSIVFTLEANYYDVNYEKRDHVKPYYLYEEVKEKGLEYYVTITLNNGYELKVDQYAAVFEDWTEWSNEGSQNEDVYADALKDWYLASAWQDYEQSMHEYYRQSALNGLAELLEQKETKHYVLAYPYQRYGILSVHPTRGQIITDFNFDRELSFMEPDRNLETFENLLYMLSLFNNQNLIAFPSEEEQIALLQSFTQSKMVPEEEKIWVDYKKNIMDRYGMLQESQIKEEVEELKETTGKTLKELLEENHESMTAFLLKLAVLLESNGQSGGSIFNDNQHEAFLKESLSYQQDDYVKEVINLALARYQESMI